MAENICKLLQGLGLENVKGQAYFKQAVTHSSYANERNNEKKKDEAKFLHNERLEFLGDAVLELIISDYIYNNFNELPEGKMTRLRASLVCEKCLVKIASELSLGDYLLLGKGEIASKGFNRPSLLADALEALIGVIYITLGFEETKKIVIKMFLPMLKSFQEDNKSAIDYKTVMQEFTQERFSVTPRYQIVSSSGPDHERIFVAQFLLKDKIYGQGEGRSKKDAQQNAARVAYEKLVKKA